MNILCTEEVAILFGMSPDWVQDHVDQLKGVKIGKRFFFNSDVFEEIFKNPTPIRGQSSSSGVHRVLDTPTVSGGWILQNQPANTASSESQSSGSVRQWMETQGSARRASEVASVETGPHQGHTVVDHGGMNARTETLRATYEAIASDHYPR